MNFKHLGIALLALSVSTAALADETGVYVGGQVGSTKSEVRGGGDAVRTTPTNWGVYVGYNFDRHFALEAGYRDLGNSWVNGVARSRDRTLGVDLVGRLPVADRFDVYGKVGVANIDRRFTAADERGSRNRLGASVAVGAQYRLTDALSLRLEAQRFLAAPTIDVGNARFKSNVTAYTVGMNYRF